MPWQVNGPTHETATRLSRSSESGKRHSGRLTKVASGIRISQVITSDGADPGSRRRFPSPMAYRATTADLSIAAIDSDRSGRNAEVGYLPARRPELTLTAEQTRRLRAAFSVQECATATCSSIPYRNSLILLRMLTAITIAITWARSSLSSLRVMNRRLNGSSKNGWLS